MVDEYRLERLEEKLDKVIDALERLVRLEERHESVAVRVDRVEGRQDTHAQRLMDLEGEMKSRGAVAGKVERFIWIVTAGLVGVVVSIWKA